MWEWIKAFFKDPVYVEKPAMLPTPKEIVFDVPTAPVKMMAPNGTFYKGMWVMAGTQIGILAEFKGADIMFHAVDTETGLTIEETQLSTLRIRQAKYDEIPPCRMGLTREEALGRGYGS